MSPFMLVNSGAPYNVTVGEDLYGDDTFNDRPELISGATCPARSLEQGSVICTPLGTFNTLPAQGSNVLPINSGTGPAAFTFNLRLSKTFGFGPEVSTGRSNRDRGFGGGGGRGGGGGGGGGFGGRGLVAPQSERPPEESASRHYNLTFSVSARNLFNVVNLGAPVANINSPEVGRSLSLAGGPFASGNATRRIDLQTMFTF
jgi:hypothetical protein